MTYYSNFHSNISYLVERTIKSALDDRSQHCPYKTKLLKFIYVSQLIGETFFFALLKGLTVTILYYLNIYTTQTIPINFIQKQFWSSLRQTHSPELYWKEDASRFFHITYYVLYCGLPVWHKKNCASIHDILSHILKQYQIETIKNSESLVQNVCKSQVKRVVYAHS